VVGRDRNALAARHHFRGETGHVRTSDPTDFSRRSARRSAA
jgi:hypothetical protein